jgi:hypothetical protein
VISFGCTVIPPIVVDEAILLELGTPTPGKLRRIHIPGSS